MKRYMIWYLAFAMFAIGIVPRAEAGLAGSEPLAASATDRAADAQRIQALLESKLVRQRLLDLGYTVEEVSAKLGEISDQQLHTLAMSLDSLRTGGDGVGLVIALLVVAILVVILIQLTGHHIRVG